MTSPAQQLPAPHELLDDGQPPLECRVLVVGCGNILRGDDAVGPVLIRHLWERGVPPHARIVDGGTAGMDVAFQMRGARRVVIVDAASTGAAPGTVFRVPAEQLAQLPPIDGLHTHSFRWDHALSFSRWLLGPEAPSDVTVYLIEAADLQPGAELSPKVAEAMELVLDRIVREEFAEPDETATVVDEGVAEIVEITDNGYLRIAKTLAEQWFPASVCGLVREADQLLMFPLQTQANGGALLKQRTAAEDRALLVREVLDDDLPVGSHAAHWDDQRACVVVDLNGSSDV